MEELEHGLFIVELFNKLFSKPAANLLALLGIEVKNPDHLFPDYVVISLIVAGFLILFFTLSARKPKLIPSKLQSVLELIIQLLFLHSWFDLMLCHKEYDISMYSLCLAGKPVNITS